MLEKPESKGLDFIPDNEFKRRNAAFFSKYGGIFLEYNKEINENKITWGKLVEINAEKYTDNFAIKFEDSALTYREFNEWVNRYTHYFLSIGLKKGDVVELMMTNRPEYLMILTAIGKIGAITSLINIDLREASLAHCLKLTLGKIIIVGENCISTFNKVKSELDLSQVLNLCFLPYQNLISTPEGFIDLSQKVKKFPTENPSTTASVKSTDPITYIFTSGTTGFPKATIFVHGTMVACYYLFGRAILDLSPEDTMYVSLPLFHSNSLGAGCASTFGGGSAIALARKFSVNIFWEDIRKFNATSFNYIGEVCRYLLNQPAKTDDSINPVKMVIGAGLRPELWKDFKERFNIPKIAEYYSATEAVGSFANFLNFDCTVGCCINSYAIVKYDHDEEKPIRNKEGFMERVDIGESGLLLFELGPAVFRGYTDKKATESKIFHDVLKEGDKWFNTGDLMRDIGNNHGQFVDRLGDTFRWKGHNISTTEVEKVINKFDQVLFSTVYGVKIPGTDGRAGMAAIVPSTSVEDFNLKELCDLLKKNLPAYGVPIFLRLKSELTTTATFKLKKVKLKKEGFDLRKIDEPMYVLLPGESDFTSLLKENYENIQKQRYKF
ncbi:MAG: long-chain-acyl-CoA synthetase [Promethearchaeota archaeon]|jgi:citronellyl-CoA synthetase